MMNRSQFRTAIQFTNMTATTRTTSTPSGQKLSRTATLTAAAALAFGFNLNSALAQTPGAIDQVNNVQQRRTLEDSANLRYDNGDTVPELYPGESDDVGPQTVLAVKRRRTWVEGVADIQYFYTDNVFLDHSARIPSGVMVGTAQADISPTFKVGDSAFTPRIGFRQQWFQFYQYRTDIMPALGTYNFNAQTAFADEYWTWHNWTLGAGFDFTRLMSTPSYSQFYREYVPRWEFSRLIPVGQHAAVSVGYQGYYHFSNASEFQILPQNAFFDRLDQLFVANFTWAPSDNFFIQPYYIFRHTHFTRSIDRDDNQNTVGVGAYYYFNRYISARVFTSYDNRQSDVEVARYHQFGAGTGANVTVRF